MSQEPDVWETCHPVSEALCKGLLAGAVFGGVSATHCQVDDFCDKKKGCSGPFKKSNWLKPEMQQASLVPPSFTVHAGEEVEYIGNRRQYLMVMVSVCKFQKLQKLMYAVPARRVGS